MANAKPTRRNRGRAWKFAEALIDAGLTVFDADRPAFEEMLAEEFDRLEDNARRHPMARAATRNHVRSEQRVTQ